MIALVEFPGGIYLHILTSKAMKYIITVCLTLMSLGVLAQETRDIVLKITNKRGKGVSGIVVQAEPSGEVGITGADGRYVFTGLTPDSRITMFLPKHGQTTVPVEGLDSLQVILRSASQVNYLNAETNQSLNIGYGTASRAENTRPVSQLDAAAIVTQSSPRDLIELLRGRVAGLDIGPDGSAKIRGTSSILLSSEPLVVLDGVSIGTLQDANNMISVYDIQTVSVLKEGSIYGSRGANGVILITTKK